MLSRVIAKNVGGVFVETHCISMSGSHSTQPYEILTQWANAQLSCWRCNQCSQICLYGKYCCYVIRLITSYAQSLSITGSKRQAITLPSSVTTTSGFFVTAHRYITAEFAYWAPNWNKWDLLLREGEGCRLQNSWAFRNDLKTYLQNSLSVNAKCLLRESWQLRYERYCERVHPCRDEKSQNAFIPPS